MIGIAVCGAIAVVIGIGAAIWAVTRPASPADIALRYFSALNAGDADAALAVTVTPETDPEDLVRAYASVSARVSDARVTDTTETAGTAEVVVAYDIAGDPRESTLEMSRTAGGSWTITDGLGTLVVSTTIGDTAAVGGLDVATGRPISLLPGGYDVEPLPRGLLSGTSATVISPGSEQSVALEPSLTPEAADAAQDQLDLYADACTRPAARVPSNCGLRVPWAADLATLTSIAFRVDRRPTLTLSPDGTTFAATGGVVVATATGTTRDGGAGAFTYRADDWALRGTVSFAGDEMVLAVG